MEQAQRAALKRLRKRQRKRFVLWKPQRETKAEREAWLNAVFRDRRNDVTDRN
jgi:hypothetical protein